MSFCQQVRLLIFDVHEVKLAGATRRERGATADTMMGTVGIRWVAERCAVGANGGEPPIHHDK
jgi:hypothetical protein